MSLARMSFVLLIVFPIAVVEREARALPHPQEDTEEAQPPVAAQESTESPERKPYNQPAPATVVKALQNMKRLVILDADQSKLLELNVEESFGEDELTADAKSARYRLFLSQLSEMGTDLQAVTSYDQTVVMQLKTKPDEQNELPSKFERLQLIIEALTSPKSSSPEAAESEQLMESSIRIAHSDFLELTHELERRFPDLDYMINQRNQTVTMRGSEKGIQQAMDYFEEFGARKHREKASGDVATKIFPLEHVEAKELVEMLQQLGLENKSLAIAASPQNSAIVLRGAATSIKGAEALIQELDVYVPDRKAVSELQTELEQSKSQYGSNHPRVVSLERQLSDLLGGVAATSPQEQASPIGGFLEQSEATNPLGDLLLDSGSSPTQTIDQLEKSYQDADEKTKQIANEIRQLVPDGGEPEGATERQKVERLRVQLKQAVGQAFDARYKMQLKQAELAEASLKRSRERLTRRAQSRLQIIERRVEQLQTQEPGSSMVKPPKDDSLSRGEPDRY